MSLRGLHLQRVALAAVVFHHTLKGRLLLPRRAGGYDGEKNNYYICTYEVPHDCDYLFQFFRSILKADFPDGMAVFCDKLLVPRHCVPPG